MPKAKVAVTLYGDILERLDRLVHGGHFRNRSQAVEVAVTAKLERMERRRLVTECAKLGPAAEQALAEEGLGVDAVASPAY
jgi:Arc/MetJ-type ribon-helix-helix transcriptional regulator